MTFLPKSIKARQLAFGIVAIPLALALYVIGNRPNQERVEFVRRSLAEAGFPDASVQRQLITGNMAKCKVGQVQNKGRAYGWSIKTASGVFCLPEDGRQFA